MRGHWAIPLMFGILFFSSIFSAQDVYGPHYTSFSGMTHHYQGAGQFSQFDVSIFISEGLGNPKKNANFEVCVRLDTATDTRTVPIEIVSMNLESCQPLTVGGQETDLNFLRVLVPVTGDPVFTPSMIADISGSYEIFNPGGKSMVGEIEIFAEDVVLDIVACIPPQCSDNDDGTDDGDGCGPNGTCVADDLCQCDDGFHGEFCTIPDCKSNVDCNDGDSCTQEFCLVDEGVCAFVPIPGCDPGERCLSNEDCDDGNQCTLNFCDSIGNCQYPPAPGGAPCDDGEFCSSNDVCNGDGACRAGPPTCGPGNTCDEQGEQCQCNIVIQCAPGYMEIDTDGDGCDDACVPNLCNASGECNDLNSCTIDECNPNGICEYRPDPTCEACSSNTSCDDGDICTTDFCSVGGACGHQPNPNCCTSDDQCEFGGVCDTDTGVCSIPRCGDGVINPGEECDDGNQTDGDGCSAACLDETCESNSDCRSDLVCIDGLCQPSCQIFCVVPNPVCGVDGNTYWCGQADAACHGVEVAHPGECEPCICPEIYDPVCGVDGATYDNQCFAQCAHVEIAHLGVCEADCTPDVCDVTLPVCGADGVTYDCPTFAECRGVEIAHEGECAAAGSCGDGTTNPEIGEQCDDRVDTANCDADCTFPSCGDSHHNPVIEQCDDSDANNNNDCTNSCQFATCGDGIEHNQGSGTEQCDDGNGNHNDNCTNFCQDARCGDGIAWNSGSGTEQCDDGNTQDLDLCSNACTFNDFSGEWEFFPPFRALDCSVSGELNGSPLTVPGDLRLGTFRTSVTSPDSAFFEFFPTIGNPFTPLSFSTLNFISEGPASLPNFDINGNPFSLTGSFTSDSTLRVDVHMQPFTVNLDGATITCPESIGTVDATKSTP